MMNFFHQLQSTADKVDFMQSLENPTNLGMHLYRSLNAHPWIIIIPLVLSLVFWILSAFVAKRIQKKESIFVFWILAHAIFIVLAIVFPPTTYLIFGHWTLFLTISLIFYGLQFWAPLSLALALLSRKIRTVFPVPAKRHLQFLCLIYALCILSVSAYAFFIEPFNIQTSFYKYRFPDPDLKGRIVHITDIQTDYLSRREENLIRQVNELNPDIIVITGDYFNGCKLENPKAFESARYVLENLHAAKGIYAVSSDSNCYSDHPDLFAGLDINYLENSSISVELNGHDLEIIGVSRRFPDIDLAWPETSKYQNSLLIYHGPSIFFWPEIQTRQPDLILTGHTHGGQISLPFIGPLTSATKYGRELAQGFFHQGKTTMYVNRGVGMEGNFAPKIRFLTPPEIAVFDLGR